eukprot:106879-Hanusia_phi.AAC.2
MAPPAARGPGLSGSRPGRGRGARLTESPGPSRARTRGPRTVPAARIRSVIRLPVTPAAPLGRGLTSESGSSASGGTVPRRVTVRESPGPGPARSDTRGGPGAPGHLPGNAAGSISLVIPSDGTRYGRRAESGPRPGARSHGTRPTVTVIGPGPARARSGSKRLPLSDLKLPGPGTECPAGRSHWGGAAARGYRTLSVRSWLPPDRIGVCSEAPRLRGSELSLAGPRTAAH